MSCKARIGVWAAVLLLGCSGASDDDDDGLDNPGVAGSAGAAVMMGPITGNPQAGVGGNAGSVSVGGGGTVGAAGNTMTAGMGAAGNAMTAGMGAAGEGAGGMMAGGTGGTTAGAGGAAGMTGGTGGTMAPTAVGAPCITAGSQVVFIGDSYSRYGLAHLPMSSYMQELARMGGALAAGDTYADYAQAGTTLAGAFASIPPQWENNKSKVPIHLVIMDGGGNDVLIDNDYCLADGSHENPMCIAVVDRSMMMAKTLWASMKGAGVKDVIWFWYPHIPGVAGKGDGHDINDYTLEILIRLAAEASVDDFRVHMVDTIPIFMGREAELFAFDGVHANDDGTAAIADAMWKLMKDKCIGQGPSSGCCKQ
jgi:lysophospholipase L1-like esterase